MRCLAIGESPDGAVAIDGLMGIFPFTPVIMFIFFHIVIVMWHFRDTDAYVAAVASL